MTLTPLEQAAVDEVRAKIHAEREDTRAAWTAAAEATDRLRTLWHQRHVPNVPSRPDSGAT